MSNSINWSKPTAFAKVITGKQVNVVPGNPGEGPHTDGRKITMGEAVSWDEQDRFAVLVHECCHLIFPANYPGGNIRELSNLIDDCRIERQFINGRPQYEDVLSALAINVIANGYYDKSNIDRWSEEHFDPSLWALLFFRPHCGDEVRLAAAATINAYVDKKGYRKDPKWNDDFAAMVEEAQRITRLKTVSLATLEKWCLQYFTVFPEAKKAANSVLPVAILCDHPAPKGEQKDSEGSGNVKADAQIRIQAGAGKDGEGEEDEADSEPEDGESQSDNGQDKGEPEKKPKNASAGQKNDAKEKSGEAKTPENLDEALEKLKKACGEVGKTKRKAAENSTQAEASMPSDDVEIESGDDEVYSNGIGKEKGIVEATKAPNAVDDYFTNRVKMSMRKLRTLIMDRMDGHKKVGRLHLPTVISAERRGILPRKPFISSVDDLVDAPIACVVATDFSSSTAGFNLKLNNFSHNALYALQAAGCECAEVVWNTGASITKTLEQRVSAVQCNRHNSDGGTSLVAASQGCITALKPAKSHRKVAFVFTDGAVSEREVPMLSKNLSSNGFEACLLVALGEQVRPSGIVETELCSDIEQLVGVFDRWVRKQAVRAAQAQYQ